MNLSNADITGLLMTCNPGGAKIAWHQTKVKASIPRWFILGTSEARSRFFEAGQILESEAEASLGDMHAFEGSLSRSADVY